MNALFLNLLRTSAVVGGLSVLLALASPLWNRRFAALWKKRLWCLLAALGLLGILIQAPWAPVRISVPLRQREAAVQSLQDVAAAQTPQSPAPESDPSTPVPAAPPRQMQGGEAALEWPEAGEAAGSVSWLTAAELIWAAGAAAALLGLTAGRYYFRRRMRRWGRAPAKVELLEAYQTVCPDMQGCRKAPELLILSQAPSPLLTGLFRPKLVLPTEDYARREAVYILRHELAHWRSGDLWWKLLLCAVGIVHWFNPAMWLLRWEANRDMERACDDRVLEGAGAEERRAYGEVLLSAVDRGRSSVASACFYGGMGTLRERLRNILSGKKRRGAALAAACGAAALCLTALISCQMQPAEEEAVLPRTNAAAETGRRSLLLLGLTPETGACDTLLLLTCDADSRAATVLSIPRDTMVNVPWDIKRINSVYSWYGGGQAGIDATSAEVAELLGFWPDYTAAVNWDTLGRLVDAMGGVYFDVPLDMDYDDPLQNLSIHIEKGYQLLNGEGAMGVVRYRRGSDLRTGYFNGDSGRIETQQAFLKAAAEQLLDGEKTAVIQTLMDIFLEDVTTDMTAADLLWFARWAGMETDVPDLTFVTLPCEPVSYWSETFQNNQSYLLPKTDELLELVNETLSPLESCIRNAPESR